MKESFNVKNVFSYIAKRFYVVIIFAAVFLILGVIYITAPQTKETELTENGKYYKYTQNINIIPYENSDLVELERFKSVIIPEFNQIVSSEDAHLKLYNNIKEDVEELREVYPKADTLKDVYDLTVIRRVANNTAVLSVTGATEEKARQYAEEYMSYIMPDLEALSEDYIIEIGEGIITEVPLEDEVSETEEELEDNRNIIIMFILLGVLVGFIIALLMYALSDTVRNEFDLKSVFSKLPVLTVFNEKGKYLSQADANFKTALNTLEIRDYLITSPDILKPNEKDYILKAVGAGRGKFVDFATDTEKFYQGALSVQGIVIAAKRFKTEIDSLKNLIDSLSLNKINIIGFILFN